MKNLPKGLTIVPHNDTTIGRLYQTNIVEIDHRRKRLILRNGGWETKHTKKCTNMIISEYGLNVTQKDFKWYVVSQNRTVPYVDGMSISLK